MTTFLLFSARRPVPAALPAQHRRQSAVEAPGRDDGADPLSRPASKAAAIILMPLIGVGLMQLGLALAADEART
jgi:hypothetical protein